MLQLTWHVARRKSRFRSRRQKMRFSIAPNGCEFQSPHFYRARPMHSWYSKTEASSGIISGNASKGLWIWWSKTLIRLIRRFPTGQRNGSKALSTCKTLRRLGSGRCFRADHAQVVAEARIVGCGFLNVFCPLHSAYCISCISLHFLCWR